MNKKTLFRAGILLLSAIAAEAVAVAVPDSAKHQPAKDVYKRQLYYSDISEVIYKPTTLFGKLRGYHVTVVTGVRDFTYRYIFDRHDDLCEPRHTPFYLSLIHI